MPIKASVKDYYDNLIGLWTDEIEKFASPEILSEVLKNSGEEKLSFEASLGSYRIVPNGVDDQEGYFIVFGTTLAPGEPEKIDYDDPPPEYIYKSEQAKVRLNSILNDMLNDNIDDSFHDQIHEVFEMEEGIEDPTFWWIYGDSFKKSGDQDLAKQAYTKCWQLERRYPFFEKNPVMGNLVNIELGTVYFEEQNYISAKTHFKAALDYYYDPDDERHQLVNQIIAECQNKIDADENEECQHSDEPPTPSAKETKEGCFIATAVFNSPVADEVLTLRLFRDKILLRNKAGRAFISAYYVVSPCIADFIKNRKILKILIKFFIVSPSVICARYISKNTNI